jgi:hypothetical protein
VEIGLKAACLGLLHTPIELVAWPQPSHLSLQDLGIVGGHLNGGRTTSYRETQVAWRCPIRKSGDGDLEMRCLTSDRWVNVARKGTVSGRCCCAVKLQATEEVRMCTEKKMRKMNNKKEAKKKGKNRIDGYTLSE